MTYFQMNIYNLNCTVSLTFLPIFQITNCSLKTKTKPSVYHKRFIATHRIETLRSHLISTDWDFIQSSSPNELYNSFMGFLCPIYEKCFPIKTVPLKDNLKTKPWFTTGLLNSCHMKNTLYKQYCNNPSPENKVKYSKFRNKYNYLIKLSRKKYYHDKLTSVSSSLKQTWTLIKSVISSKHSNNNPISIKDSTGKTTNNPQSIVNKFNDFFTNIALL